MQLIPLKDLLLPVQYLEILEGLVRSRNGNPTELFTACGLTEQQARDPLRTIDGEQFKSAINASLPYCIPGQSLTIQYLAHVPMTVHGPLGLLALASRTIGDAVAAAEQYMPMILPAFAIRVETIRDEVHIIFNRMSDFGELNDLVTEVVMGGFGMIHPFLSKRVTGVTIHMRHKAKNALPPYPGDLVDHILYNSSNDKIVMPKSMLSIPLQTQSPLLHASFTAALRQQARTDRQAHPHSQQVRRIIKDLIYEHKMLHGDIVAEQMCLSRRTLNRRLEEEGTTLADLVIEVRMAYAETLLLTTDHSISDVARKAGFTAMSNFSRAFKRVFGQSPRERRLRSTLNKIT